MRPMIPLQPLVPGAETRTQTALRSGDSKSTRCGHHNAVGCPIESTNLGRIRGLLCPGTTFLTSKAVDVLDRQFQLPISPNRGRFSTQKDRV
jgi:hypothetical protein